MPKTLPIDFSTTLDTSNLKDKSVLITGGASGIGLAGATAVASAGAFVTIVDLQEELGIAVAKELSFQGYKVQFVQTDVTSYESQTAAFKSAIEFGGGKIDIVIPSAGIIAEKNLLDMVAGTEPSLDSVPPVPSFSGVEVNLKGVYYTCYLALYYFKLPEPEDTAPFKKAIILIASVAGYLGYPSSTTYSISKFGVRGILHGIRAKAAEQTPQIRINLIAPWFVKTPMTVDPSKPDAESLMRAGRMYGFAPMENVVDAIMRFSVNEKTTGRAALIMPDGNVDLEDDIWGGYGGPVMQQQMGTALERIIKEMK
ncbi:NAD(P)-binding protein [Melanomma pulvis-pyrius CBS 109.77]|uniref:NAD(P)-binding protein n=1 Tax=Melanomma pulvis-pyrius CBS 109.77 TaxID=1314802 RepID=A0A6A6X8U0_9PLEO|nr:NAD(P)-binding protein [Melanomma pulvis-pyrius CBS 109.77]